MKRHLPLAAILVLAFASFCFAQPQATPSPSPKPYAPRVTKAQLQKQLSEMETALWTAWKNKDAKPFETHLASDSVMVGEEGVGAKNDIVKMMASMPCDVKSFMLTDWKLTKLGASTALITYKGAAEGTCGGQAIPTTWASSLWVKRKGTWQAVFHQETPVK
ncbi:MAG TPA: nuclear transport factor 2 family protein [Pyrinomonadaceae bacterium]|jgi:hypothetical protein